jgi:hypothetical protein
MESEHAALKSNIHQHKFHHIILKACDKAIKHASPRGETCLC